MWPCRTARILLLHWEDKSVKLCVPSPKGPGQHGFVPYSNEPNLQDESKQGRNFLCCCDYSFTFSSCTVWATSPQNSVESYAAAQVRPMSTRALAIWFHIQLCASCSICFVPQIWLRLHLSSIVISRQLPDARQADANGHTINRFLSRSSQRL